MTVLRACNAIDFSSVCSCNACRFVCCANCGIVCAIRG
jgi:hypothetical protein